MMDGLVRFRTLYTRLHQTCSLVTKHMCRNISHQTIYRIGLNMLPKSMMSKSVCFWNRLHICRYISNFFLKEDMSMACTGSKVPQDHSTFVSDVNTLHTPVLVKEIVDLIDPRDGQVILDMTFGAGGHSKALFERCRGITVYALDRDPLAFKLAKQLAHSGYDIVPLLGCFTDIHRLLHERGSLRPVDAVLFDVGVSSMQFDSTERGFSLSRTGALDMRMDADRIPNQLTAEDVINNMSEEGLRNVIKKYGEEKQAKMIARAIVDSRYAFGRITTTTQLADIVASVHQGNESRRDKLNRPAHVATKTFQALRIFVNNELNELHNALNMVHGLLRPNGLCAVVTFHSLEDRIVKRHFRGLDVDAKSNMSITDRHRNPLVIHDIDQVEQLLVTKWQPLWKGPLLPSGDEIEANPRARSAKLRAARKLSTHNSV